MRLKWLGKRNDENNEQDAPENGSKKKSRQSKDPIAWVESLQDDAQVRIYHGSSYLAAVDASDIKAAEMPIEEMLLDDLGPGRYRLVPVVNGKMQHDRALHISVGRYEPTRLTKPTKTELDTLKEYIADLEKRLEEKQRPQINLQDIVSSVATAMTTLVQLSKGDTELLSRLLEKLSTRDDGELKEVLRALIERTLAEDPIEKVRNLMELSREFSPPAPVEQEQLAGNDGFYDIARQSLDLIARKILGPPQANAQANAPSMETPTQPTPSTNAPPSALGALDIFIGRLREMIRGGASAAEVAETILQGADTAMTFAPNSPLVRQVIQDPESGFDMLASHIPEFHENDAGRSFRDQVKRLVVQRIQEFKQGMTSEQPTTEQPTTASES